MHWRKESLVTVCLPFLRMRHAENTGHQKRPMERLRGTILTSRDYQVAYHPRFIAAYDEVVLISRLPYARLLLPVYEGVWYV
jgi:hypothetical protein